MTTRESKFYNPGEQVFVNWRRRIADEERVTLPRQVLPGDRYLVTRRCTQRQFLLRPCKLTNQIFEYCIAIAAARTGVAVHAVCVMSNHWHAVVTDNKAQLPEFLRTVHKLTASCINAACGREENMWANSQPSAVRLVSDEDVLDKIAYTLANPTLAGLVKSPKQWPGVLRGRIGSAKTVLRPRVFFAQHGRMPASAVLSVVRPQLLESYSDHEIQNMISRAVTKRVRAARTRLRRERRSFLGPERVRRQSITADLAPQIRETSRRRACARETDGDGWRRVAENGVS